MEAQQRLSIQRASRLKAWRTCSCGLQRVVQGHVLFTLHDVQHMLHGVKHMLPVCPPITLGFWHLSRNQPYQQCCRPGPAL